MNKVKNLAQITATILVMFVKNLLGIYAHNYKAVAARKKCSVKRVAITSIMFNIAVALIASTGGAPIVSMLALVLSIDLFIVSVASIVCIMHSLKGVELGRMVREGVANVLYGNVQREEFRTDYVHQPSLMAA